MNSFFLLVERGYDFEGDPGPQGATARIDEEARGLKPEDLG
jgi:hypothetical protein